MTTRMKTGLALAVVCAAAALTGASGALAADDPAAQKLAERYAPVMQLKHQPKPCDSVGERYRPTKVDVLLGNKEVDLIRASSKGRPTETLKSGAVAADLAGLGPDYYLNLPGDSLHPGCTYERFSKKLTPKYPPTTYAHIATEPGVNGLAVQYFFYWVYNQFTDLHESDWEMIQVEFPVDTVEEALKTEPSGVAYAQHAGGERGTWSGSKLQKEGTRPVVYPGAGSHASYFDAALYLGNGDSGFGCEDTNGPWDRLPLVPDLVRTNPSLTSNEAWLTFLGRWGQRQKGFYNGPTGPNTKQQWREPFRWSSKLRTSAPTVPLRPGVGPDASDVFCGAVTTGSKVLLVAVEQEWLVLGILGILAVLALLAVRHTRWEAVDPLPLGRPMASGQVLRAARQLHRRHKWKYREIGLAFVPVSLVATFVSKLLSDLPGVSTLSDVVGGRFIEFTLTTGVGLAFTVAAFSIVYAAVVAAVHQVEAGGTVSVGPAYRAAFARAATIAAISAIVVFTVGLLALAVVGIPLAIWKAVDWVFATPEAMIEGGTARESLRKSTRLVRKQWWSVAAFVLVVLVAGLVAGPIAGILLIVYTDLPLTLVNTVASLVYVFTIPYCAIALTLKRYALKAE